MNNQIVFQKFGNWFLMMYFYGGKNEGGTSCLQNNQTQTSANWRFMQG